MALYRKAEDLFLCEGYMFIVSLARPEEHGFSFTKQLFYKTHIFQDSSNISYGIITIQHLQNQRRPDLNWNTIAFWRRSRKSAVAPANVNG